jgi:hypothetical protein
MGANGSSHHLTDAVATPAADLGLAKGIESAFAMTDAVMSLWRSLSDEWLALSRAQLETQAQLMRSLAACRDPAAAITLQVDTAQATLSRCLSAATKASSTVSQLASVALAKTPTAHLGAD